MSLFLRIGFLTLVASLFAHAGATIAQPAASSSPEQTEYYLGEVTMQTPAGQRIGMSLSLVRRVLTPAANRIVETVATIEGAKPVREHTTVFTVSGSTFALKDDGGTFSGTGELTGEPWRWTRWRYEVEMLGERKGRLLGDDVLGPDGIVAKKSFLTPDGVVRVQFAEQLKPIGKTTYDILRAKLLPDARP